MRPSPSPASEPEPFSGRYNSASGPGPDAVSVLGEVGTCKKRIVPNLETPKCMKLLTVAYSCEWL